LKEDGEHKALRQNELQGEMTLMQSFDHPNIAKFYGSGTEPRTFMVSESVGEAGHTIGSVIERGCVAFLGDGVAGWWDALSTFGLLLKIRR